jgi:endoglucanase
MEALPRYLYYTGRYPFKAIGVNSIRVPFHYRFFTHEDFLGDNSDQRGFALLDRLIGWCRQEGLYVLLDMHCAPGGQTGDNIDDSWGYPFLFKCKAFQDKTVAIWSRIARHYAKAWVVIGYDLLNEPVAHYFNTDDLNSAIEPFYKRLVHEIRTVDKQHLIFLVRAVEYQFQHLREDFR